MIAPTTDVMMVPMTEQLAETPSPGAEEQFSTPQSKPAPDRVV